LPDKFKKIKFNIYDNFGTFSGNKSIYNFDKEIFLNNWLKKHYDKKNNKIGVLGFVANDFQNQKLVFITTNGRGHHETFITYYNLKEILIYFSVRHIIIHSWLNHNDQFLEPYKQWQKDKEFQNDCIAFALFFEKNQIKSKDGINHWIPFTEHEVNAQAKFESHFMTDFIKGKIKPEEPESNLFVMSEPKPHYEIPLQFSEKATAVFDAGRELWKYYHLQKDVNVNASLYDIREYFQGRNDKGKMNNKSKDSQYMVLIASLRDSLKILAKKIEPKVYEYGFLKQ